MPAVEFEGQSFGNEVANSVTHGIGAILGVAGLVVLIVVAAMHGTARHVVAVSIFGTSLTLLYLASTLYHSIPAPRAKRVFQIIDHSAIYLLIAGTYTPFALISLEGTWRWTVFGIAWGLALVGVTLKAFFTGRFGILSTAVYLGMGWMAALLIKPLLSVISPLGIFWLVAGGVAYTVGIVFYAWRSFSYGHALWHGFVLAGSACHYFAVLLYVLPRG
ncbi:MAG TPA: hemolysin III family protein [Kiritimatiellia bacterium]|jgi:hemolysin III